MENLQNDTNTVPFLSLNQTIKALDCSRHFIYTLINEGKIKPKHINRKPYFMIEDIINLLDRQDA